MIDKLYTTISIGGMGGILMVFALGFLLHPVPDNLSLRNYRVALRIMAGAYLFFLAINIVECCYHSVETHVPLTQMVTLVVACSQAILFTCTLIMLVNTRFVTRRRILTEVIPVLLFIVAAFISYSVCSEAGFRVFLYIFAAFYVCLLVHYVRMFRKNYRHYRLQMDNFFAGDEVKRLQWVAFSFHAALTVGILALASALFMSALGSLLFSILLIAFYIHFGFRLIGYTSQFPFIEAAITAEEYGKDDKLDPKVTLYIEEKLKTWVAEKYFIRQDVTLDSLSHLFFTNNKYLSSYFNSVENKTFRDWLNGLRIEEAKTLLVAHPEITVAEVAERTGFSNPSNFGRQFLKQTGYSPKVWREQAG
ncbi:MAG: helix-turn-helix domain-containing protein [Dysgonamonadaceae bacterium]|jgi:AraC-like DNA-binding protein|nr:helix-turn-helix domain-containing protein [Dysgonamonadaceae bacterium]